MFSFGIWDGNRRRLFLARDRLGVKPLYYYYRDNCMLFASELKGLMSFRHYRREVDIQALAQYLQYQYVPSPWTIFRYTRKLEPGHCLLLKGGNLKVWQYWDLSVGKWADGGSNERSEYDFLEELDEVLSRSVSGMLVSDVPLGALLSGGIDSSVIVSLMCRASHKTVKTYTVGFRDQEYDEAPHASKVANYLGTDHRALYVSSKKALDIIPEIPDIYDEPFADSSAIPTCLLSSLARSSVTVALSGDGGDELFGGYLRYWATAAMAKKAEEVNFLARKILPPLLHFKNFGDKWEKAIRQLGREGLESLYRATITLWDADEIMGILGRKPASGRFERLFSETETLPVISRLMRVDQLTYLPDAMLTKVDRASMACGLEVRVPLLDHRVVEFAAGIPEDLKVRDGRGKYLLRKLLARFVPPKLFDRTKMGFALPLEPWLRTDLKPLLRDYLSAECLEKEGLFDTRPVHRMLREHFSGRANHHHRLWALLVWEMWRERWLT